MARSAFLSALIAVAKPLLQITGKIQRLEELVGEYRLVEHELKRIEVAVKQQKSYGPDLQTRFDGVLEKMTSLYSKQGEYKVREKLLAKCEKEVAQELPSARFYIPKEEDDARG
jgi:hypothetical protein